MILFHRSQGVLHQPLIRGREVAEVVHHGQHFTRIEGEEEHKVFACFLLVERAAVELPAHVILRLHVAGPLGSAAPSARMRS